MCQRHEIKPNMYTAMEVQEKRLIMIMIMMMLMLLFIRSDLNSFVRNKEFAAYNLLVLITIGLRSKTVASSQNGTIQKDLH